MLASKWFSTARNPEKFSPVDHLLALRSKCLLINPAGQSIWQKLASELDDNGEVECHGEGISHKQCLREPGRPNGGNTIGACKATRFDRVV